MHVLRMREKPDMIENTGVTVLFTLAFTPRTMPCGGLSIPKIS